MFRKIQICIIITAFFALFSKFDVLYSSSHLNYGLYWLGYYSASKKQNPEVYNPYYNPSRPTVIFFHGWKKGDNKKAFPIEDFYWDKANKHTHHGWLDKGWNVGVFDWAQWADEDDVQWAESKIWSRNGPRGFRYKLANGEYGHALNPSGQNRAVGELAKEIIVEALEENDGNEIRFVGHSLGSQLATRTAKLIFDDIMNGKLDEETYKINRLSLLDPAWTKNGKYYLGDSNGDQRDDWVGERCRWAIFEMIDYWTDMAVDIYNSTMLDKQLGVAMDANGLLRREVCGTISLRPWYYKAHQLAEKHMAAMHNYFWSMESAPPVECTIKWMWKKWRFRKVRIVTGSMAPSAATPNWRIRQMMGKGHMWDQVEGRKTVNPSDDWFEIKKF